MLSSAKINRKLRNCLLLVSEYVNAIHIFQTGGQNSVKIAIITEFRPSPPHPSLAGFIMKHYCDLKFTLKQVQV